MRGVKLIALPLSHMTTSTKPDPWRHRAPPTALHQSLPSASAREPPLESLDPLSKTRLVKFAPFQCATLFSNLADAVAYEVEDPQYGYDDVGAPSPAVFQAEVHRAAGAAPEEPGTGDYLVPGQDD